MRLLKLDIFTHPPLHSCLFWGLRLLGSSRMTLTVTRIYPRAVDRSFKPLPPVAGLTWVRPSGPAGRWTASKCIDMPWMGALEQIPAPCKALRKCWSTAPSKSGFLPILKWGCLLLLLFYWSIPNLYHTGSLHIGFYGLLEQVLQCGKQL